MAHLFSVLGFVTLYGLGMSGGKKGTASFISGLILNLSYIIFRWASMGHIPVTDRYDSLIVMGFISALGGLFLHLRKEIDGFMNFFPLLPIGFCLLGIFQERVDTISPNMNSEWFFLFMIFFIVGFSLMGIGSVLGGMFLWYSRVRLEILQYRFTLAGWLSFSFALVAGSVWFFLAYGVYWYWSAKELWTTISWLYYGFYLHGRLLNSMRGWLASEIGAAGLAILLFAYLGVTPVLGSPWSQF